MELHTLGGVTCLSCLSSCEVIGSRLRSFSQDNECYPQLSRMTLFPIPARSKMSTTILAVRDSREGTAPSPTSSGIGA
eukprot:9703-Amphidinium_carterae.1